MKGKEGGVEKADPAVLLPCGYLRPLPVRACCLIYERLSVVAVDGLVLSTRWMDQAGVFGGMRHDEEANYG